MNFEEDHISASSYSSSSSSADNIQSNSDTQTPENVPLIINSQKRKAGRKKFKETRHPIYRCVRERKGGKWVCEVREPNKKSRIWLGTFPTPEMAARAHDVAALALRGEGTSLNFEDSPWLLKRAKSDSPSDIQAAAFAGAMAFAPPETSSSHYLHGENVRKVMKPLTINLPTMTEEKIGVEGDNSDSSRIMFVDEEELFNMPGLIDSMAEGLLITPPAMKNGFQWGDMDCDIDLTLWGD